MVKIGKIGIGKFYMDIKFIKKQKKKRIIINQGEIEFLIDRIIFFNIN